MEKKKITFPFIYNHFEEIILVALFAVMVVVIFLQIIMRYVFNNSLSWSEEVGRFTFEWLTWLGISLGARKGDHIKITILLEKLHLRPGMIVSIIADIIVIIICALTAYYGYVMAVSFAGSNFVSMHISLAWGYAALPAGCSLMVIRSLVSIWYSILSLREGELVLRPELKAAAEESKLLEGGAE